MQKISLIVHGKHGLNKLLRDFVELANNSDKISLSMKLTSKQGDAQNFAHDACSEQHQVIIAAGGDGTINEVVNGMMSVEGTQTKLLIVPIGTGNDFMRFRNKFQTANEILQCALNDQFTWIDLGSINTAHKRHFFLNIADIGFGGTVVSTLNRQRKYLGGKLSYTVAILRTFINFKKPHLTLHIGDQIHSGKFLLIAFCNGKSFGNGIVINPDADPGDGKLEITILKDVSIVDYLRYLPKLKRGLKIEHPQVIYTNFTKCSIQLDKGKADIEVDGESISLLNPEIRIHKSKIRLCEPTITN